MVCDSGFRLRVPCVNVSVSSMVIQRRLISEWAKPPYLERLTRQVNFAVAWIKFRAALCAQSS